MPISIYICLHIYVCIYMSIYMHIVKSEERMSVSVNKFRYDILYCNNCK